MSMTIGGFDVILKVPRQRFDMRRVLEVVFAAWPEAIVEDDSDGKVFRLRDVLTTDPSWHSKEFFIYHDQASADIWTEEGYTEENRGRMLHLLTVDRSPEEVELTLVVDDVSPQTSALVDNIARALSVENGTLKAAKEAYRRGS